MIDRSSRLDKYFDRASNQSVLSGFGRKMLDEAAFLLRLVGAALTICIEVEVMKRAANTVGFHARFVAKMSTVMGTKGI